MARIDFAPMAFYGVFETAGCMHHFYTLTFVSLAVEFAYPHHVPLIPAGSASTMALSLSYTTPSLLAERVHDDVSKLCFLCLMCALGGNSLERCYWQTWMGSGTFIFSEVWYRDG